MLCGLQEIKQQSVSSLRREEPPGKSSPSASKVLRSLLGKVAGNSRKAMLQIPGTRKVAFIKKFIYQNIMLAIHRREDDYLYRFHSK
ncbi:hypothetical protein Patl1_34023 [Pistacia atlantica]|uniref:Uncharacterized protein n=1 Tax=Pistacia atlantica TaxID=434234 RepID=A0ACC0ZT82_9ROSI|nr:hypothetical protein Patl1_34023 [Pistacia atlantica]